MRFRIAQCLCGPKRHAIIALALQQTPEEISDAKALEMLKAATKLVTSGHGPEIGVSSANPWCGLCGAKPKDWIYEIGWSIEFADWAAAQKELKRQELQQQASNALLALLDLTHRRSQTGSVN